MQDKTEITQRQVHVNANSGAARQLAGLTNLPFLARLSDDEAGQLAGHINEVLRANYDLGFNEGWDGATQYNADVRQLQTLPPTMTEH